MKRQLVVLAMALAVRLTAQDEVKMRTMKDVRAGRVQSTGSVSGQAIYEDTGRPVRHAKILLLPEEGSDFVFAISDREGNFHIDKLAEGKYIVEIESPGCISALSFYKASELRAESDVDVTKLKDDFA